MDNPKDCTLRELMEHTSPIISRLARDLVREVAMDQIEEIEKTSNQQKDVINFTRKLRLTKP